MLDLSSPTSSFSNVKCPPFARSVYSIESNWPEQGVGQVRSYVTCSWWFQNIRILFILLLRIFFVVHFVRIFYRTDLIGFSWRSSCAPRSLAAFSPQKVQILVQGLRKGKMKIVPLDFCNSCPNLYACLFFFYRAAFFCCLAWIFSMDIKRSRFFWGGGPSFHSEAWSLKLGAFSDARCKMTRGRRWKWGTPGKGDELKLETHQFLRGELIVLGSGIAVTRWHVWNR